jgi:hypothetical protein
VYLEVYSVSIGAERLENIAHRAPRTDVGDKETITGDDEMKYDNKRTEILMQADGLINPSGARGREYGPPEENFARIAKGWEIILGTSVSPEQVSLCMSWLKIARIAGDGKASRDSYVDAAGYVALAGELADV